jgi:hypothetical protein
MTLEPTDQIRYRFLKTIEEHPGAAQRQVASALGVGKANCCLRAVIEKRVGQGWQLSKQQQVVVPRRSHSSGHRREDQRHRCLLRRVRDEYDLLAQGIQSLVDEVRILDILKPTTATDAIRLRVQSICRAA